MFETDPATGRPHTYRLSHAAGCGDPDTPEGRPDKGDPSPGAVFLHNVYAAAREAAEYDPDADPSDTAHEVADGCVPVYTHEMWETFTDLAAYQEDLSEYGYTYDPDNPEGLPSTALYAIGYRLALHILTDEED